MSKKAAVNINNDNQPIMSQGNEYMGNEFDHDPNMASTQEIYIDNQHMKSKNLVDLSAQRNMMKRNTMTTSKNPVTKETFKELLSLKNIRD